MFEGGLIMPLSTLCVITFAFKRHTRMQSSMVFQLCFENTPMLRPDVFPETWTSGAASMWGLTPLRSDQSILKRSSWRSASHEDSRWHGFACPLD